MSVEIDISNETDVPLSYSLVKELVAEVLGREGGSGGVTVAFVSSETITELNTRYRRLAEATDVLSFRYESDAETWPEPEEIEEEPYLGDVVVCPDVAAGHAAAEGVALGDELRRLVVHGVLHLLGYDHDTDRGEMRRREELLLGELAWKVPVSFTDASAS